MNHASVRDKALKLCIAFWWSSCHLKCVESHEMAIRCGGILPNIVVDFRGIFFFSDFPCVDFSW